MSAVYPYDPDASLPTNLVKGILKHSTFPNKYNVLVPLEAPFFRKDLRLKKGELDLIEGLDYYLVYYYKKAAEGIKKPVYGGILPISNFDDVEYQLRTLGGAHMVPYTELGRYLNNPDMTDPRSTDWSDLQRYPVSVDPIDPPANFEEAYEQDIIIRSIVKIKDAVLASGPERETAFSEIFDELKATENFYNVNFLEIHDKSEHKHLYTAELVGALRKEATAVDALKAYGYTLAQMVDHAKEHGVSMKRVEELVDSNIGLLHGSLINTADAGVVVTTHGGSAPRAANIKLAIDKVTVDTGSGDVGFSGAEGGWFGAGVNSIIVPKIGGVLERPVLNGYYMLIAEDVTRYLFSPSAATLRASVNNTSNVVMFGDGTEENPIGGKISVPIATAEQVGLAFLVDEWTTDVSSAVVTQDLITQTIEELERGTFASKTITVNGEEFGDEQEVELTKAHFSLENVDNTSAAKKPATQLFIDELDKKALVFHEHEPSDLTDLVIASAEEAGLGKVGTDGFLKADKAEDFIETTTETIEAINNSLPGWASSGAYYGDSSYLPAPVLGNYGHVGYNTSHIHGEWESDVKFIYIDTGRDMFGMGCYYTTMEFNLDGTLKSHIATAVEYAPAFLGTAKVKFIYSGVDGVFALEDTESRIWLVLTNGTMEASKHKAYRINTAMWHTTKLILVGTTVYFVSYGGDSYQPWFSVRKLDLKTANPATVNDLTPLTLTGKDIFNNNVSTSGTIYFAPMGVSTNANDQARVIRADGNYWAGVNFSHAEKNADVAQKDGKLRIFGFHTPYVSNSIESSHGGTLTTSIIIDPVLGTFVIEDPNSMKVRLERSGFTQADNKNTNSWRGVSPNNTSIRFVGKRSSICIYTYLSVKNCATVVKSQGLSRWDMCGRTLAEPPRDHDSQTIVLGATVPGIKSVNRCFGFVTSNKIYTVSGDGKPYLLEVDTNTTYPGFTGFGPTSNRKLLDSAEVSYVPVNYATGVNRGWNGSFNQSRPSYVDSNCIPRDVLTFDMDNALSDRLMNLTRSEWSSVGTHLSSNVQLTVFGNPSSPEKVFLVFGIHVQETGGRKAALFYTYESSACFVNGSTIGVPGNATLTRRNNHAHHAVLSVGEVLDYGCVPFSCRVSDGTLYYIGQGIYYRFVGNGGHLMNIIGYNNNGQVSSRCLVQQAAYYDHNRCYHPKLGVMEARMSEQFDAWVGYVLENTVAGFINGTRTGTSHVLFAVKPAENWNVYFTQPYPLFINGLAYTAPAMEMDLRLLYPDKHKNRTFYVHVRVVDGEATYTIDLDREQDNETRLYLGHLKTGNDKITELLVKNVARYGNVMALEKHKGTSLAHTTAGAATLTESPYGEVKNYDVIHEFKIPTFKDIYDRWHRFSHVHNNANQPAVPGELTSWRYQESTDAVISTANTASYIGFISDDFVGDYVFNTVVYSPDGDNDLITILLAAFKKGDIDDKEHTLSLCLDQTPVSETHTRVPSNLCVMDNLFQSTEKVITDFATGRVSRAWTNTYAHVHVRKSGNVLKIAVAHRDKPALAQSSAAESRKFYDSLKLLTEDQIYASDLYLKREINLSVAAPKYARPCRFGYGAMSQASATFESVSRPGAALSNKYASEETLRLANKDNIGEHRIVNGKVALPSRPLNVTDNDVVSATVARGDNYGDRFWPLGQPTVAYLGYAGGRAQAPVTNRDGTLAGNGSRWTYYKYRFTISKAVAFRIKYHIDNQSRLWLYRGSAKLAERPLNDGSDIFSLNLTEPGEYTLTFLGAEYPNTISPTALFFEIYFDDVLTYSTPSAGVKVLTVMGGTSFEVPVLNEQVPHGVMFTYERPLGTTIAVSANLRNNRIRQQIDSGTGYELTPTVTNEEAGLCAVVVGTVESGGVLKDKIFIHTPMVTDSTAEVNYQLRITKV